MKLTAFEKSPFDPTAHQRPTIQTADNGQNSVELIRDDYTKPFLSSVKQRDIRTIDVPIEIVNRYSDGHTFKGDFKVVDVTSGELEIVHNTRQPAVTKNIDVNLRANLNLRKLERPEQEDKEPDEPEPVVDPLPLLDFQISEREFRALISIMIGNTGDPILFYDGDNNVISHIGGNNLTSKSALRSFLTNISEKYLTANKLISDKTLLIDNLADRVKLNDKFTDNSLVNSYAVSIDSVAFKRPYIVTIYFTTTSQVKHSYQVKEPVLRRNRRSIELILPYRETKSLESLDITYTNEDGGDPSAIPSSVRSYAPVNLSEREIIVNSIERMVSATQTLAATWYYIFEIGINSKYNRFLNNLKGFNSGADALLRLVLDIEEFYKRQSHGTNFGILNPGESLVSSLNPGYVTPTNRFAFYIHTGSQRIPVSTMERVVFNSTVDSWKSRIASGISNNVLTTYFSSVPWREIPVQEREVLNNTPFKLPTYSNQLLGIGQGNINVNGIRVGSVSLNETDFGIPENQNNLSRDRMFRIGLLSNITDIPLVSENTEFPSQSVNIHRELSYGFIGKVGNSLLVNKVVTDGETGFSEVRSPDNTDFSKLIIKRNNDNPTEESSGWSAPKPTTDRERQLVNNFRFARAFSLSSKIAELFDATFPERLGIRNNMPTIRDWINNNGNIFSEFNRLQVQIKDPPELEEDEPAFPDLPRLERVSPPKINLIESVDKSWPWVAVSDLYYQDGRVYIGLSRDEDAPIPPRDFFNSIVIDKRVFSSSDSKMLYSQDTKEKTAEWSWPESLNFLDGRLKVPIVLRKSGRSVTNAINESRLVRKATVETNAYKNLPAVVAGLFIKDIDFSSSYFKITFSGAVQADDFSALFIESGGLEITRQMRSADAVRSVAGGDTIFQWNSLPEFGSLMKNKSYTLGIIKNGSSLEQAFFIPRPDKVHWAWPVAMRSVATGVSVDFKINDPTDRLVFIAMGILNTDQTNFLAFKDSNEWEQTKAGDIITAEYKGGALGALAVGDKKILSFQIKDYPELAINCIKTTDFLFDTIIILNTNLKAVFLKDQVGNDLLHPSDFRSLEYQTEQGLRHLILELNNDIVSEQVTLVNRDMVKYDHRKIGQVLLLKRIGAFKQFPNIRVHSSKSRETTIDQNNLTHVKALPESLNYHMVFPALLDEDDVLLAQDLFSRVADYNEFLIWVSGGDIAPKNRGMKGFRFVDIVKSLCANELDIGYVDGRFTSGPGFEMALSQVR